MPTATSPSTYVGARRSRPVLDVVIPVHNEEDDLGPCVRRLHAYLSTELPYGFRITVADNASTDRTLARAHELTECLEGVEVLHLEEKGRGRALRRAWSASEAEVLAYMDVDLSTDLSALLPLIAPLVSGHSDLAIGTRLARGVTRRPWRQARGDLPQLQPDPAHHARRALQRRSVRIQGDPPRRGRPAPAPRRRPRLVLRHRAARARRTVRDAYPRDPGRLGGRPGQQRRPRLHRAGRPSRGRPAGASAGRPARCP